VRPIDTLCSRTLPFCIVALLAAPMAHAADDVSEKDKEKVTELQGVKVRASTATQATVATKTDAPLIEVPQSVSVVTREDLTVRNVQNLSDALNYTAGAATNATGTDQRYDWPYIRGFDAGSFGIYQDGLRSQPGGLSLRIEPYLIQSVAVLKGPSSVLYGQSTPGGLIDVTSKMPTTESLHEVGVQLGNYAQRQLRTDHGGTLDEAGHWRYRLTAIGFDDNTQIDHTYNRRLAIAPAVTYAPDDDTTVTLLTNYQRDLTNSLYPFLPAQGTVLFNPNGKLPTSLYTGDPDWDSYRRTQSAVGYRIDHRMDDVWSFHLNGRVARQTTRWRQLYGSGPLFPDNSTFNRYAMDNDSQTNSYLMDNRVTADVATGPVQHALLMGLDVSQTHSSQSESDGLGNPLSAYAPEYNLPMAPLGAPGTRNRQSLKQTGVYAQDQLKFGAGWVALLGVRRDWTSMGGLDQIADTATRQVDSKTTGRIGLVYQTSWGLAPYLSWSTSFLPNSGFDYLGRGFLPTTGRQVEAGVKYQPVNVDAFVTVSAFEIHQGNVLVTDASHPGFSRAAGEVRSRGAELEGVAHLDEGLTLRAAYTYTDAKTTKSSVVTDIGKPPGTVPMHMASLWVDYAVREGVARGLGFGGGVRRVGETYGGTYHPDVSTAATRDFNVPAYTLLDAVVRYELPSVSLALNVNNLLDKHFVSVCYGELGCSWGNRRTAMASATYRW